MKRTWLAYVAIMASVIFGTVVSTAQAENGKRSSFNLGGNKIFSQGSSSSSQGSKPSFSRSSSLQGLNLSNSNSARLQTYKPQILQGLSGNSSNSNLNPRLGGTLGIGTGKGPVWTGPLKTGDLFGSDRITKIPGLVTKLKPIDPGIGNGQPGGGGQQPGGGNQQPGNGNCNPGQGNCWFPPINIGCWPGNGGCYPVGGCYPYPVGGCYPYPIYQTQPIVVTQQPVIVEAAAPVKVEEQLLKIPVGTTVNLEGTNLGDKAGQVLIVMEKLTLGTLVNEWKTEKVVATLPMIGLAEPTKAELVVVKADGQVASNIKVLLMPAQPAAAK